MRTRWWLLIVSMISFVASCDTSVQPILESDKYFSLYGALDMRADTQFVRVVPIRSTIAQGTDTLQAIMRSYDLMTGEIAQWKDSVVVFRSGTVGHVFYAPIRVIGGHRYRLEVERVADGAKTSVEVQVPMLSREVVVEEPRVFTDLDRTVVRQKILWKGIAEEPYQQELWYRFQASPQAPFVDLQLPLTGTITEAGWEVDLDLVAQRDSILAHTGQLMVFLEMGVRLVVLTPEWEPPGGIWDKEVLAQPGVFSNVTHGFGFVGAVLRRRLL